MPPDVTVKELQELFAGFGQLLYPNYNHKFVTPHAIGMRSSVKPSIIILPAPLSCILREKPSLRHNSDISSCHESSTICIKASATSGTSIPEEALLRLYGLYKISTEGPCTAPQPSALRLRACTRAPTSRPSWRRCTARWRATAAATTAPPPPSPLSPSR